MTWLQRSAAVRRRETPERHARGTRLDARERRRLVLEVFGAEEYVDDVRVHALLDRAFAAGLHAGRVETERDLQRAYAAGWTAAQRALQVE